MCVYALLCHERLTLFLKIFQLWLPQLQFQMGPCLRVKLMEGQFIHALNIQWPELMLPWIHQVCDIDCNM